MKQVNNVYLRFVYFGPYMPKTGIIFENIRLQNGQKDVKSITCSCTSCRVTVSVLSPNVKLEARRSLRIAPSFYTLSDYKKKIIQCTPANHLNTKSVNVITIVIKIPLHININYFKIGPYVIDICLYRVYCRAWQIWTKGGMGMTRMH